MSETINYHIVETSHQKMREIEAYQIKTYHEEKTLRKTCEKLKNTQYSIQSNTLRKLLQRHNIPQYQHHNRTYNTNREKLTKQMHQLLERHPEGLTNKQFSEILGIHINTPAKYLYNDPVVELGWTKGTVNTRRRLYRLKMEVSR